MRRLSTQALHNFICAQTDRFNRTVIQESTTRDRNTLLCQVRMVQDSLKKARLSERKQKTAVNESYQVIDKQQEEGKTLKS